MKIILILLFSINTAFASTMTMDEYNEYLQCIETSDNCGEYPTEIIVRPCASVDLNIGDLHIFDVYVVDKPMVPYVKLHWNGTSFDVIEIQK